MSVERRLPDTVRLCAENLEAFGTSRADFRHVSTEDRISVARRLAIHLTRQRVDGPIMKREPHIFFHLTGRVGIEYKEARVMWDNCTERMSWDDVYAMKQPCSD